MTEWFYHLPVVWMSVVVFLATAVVTAAIYGAVLPLATGDRGRACKSCRRSEFSSRRSTSRQRHGLLDGGIPSTPRRKTRPGSAPVWSPPSITTSPLTITVETPIA
jgi:hypothetical protein